MAKIRPFKGMRFNVEKTGDLRFVTTPPYDIISPEEQENFYKSHENSVIRLEYGKEYADDTETNNRYTRAARDLQAWIDEQVLIFEEKPAIYLYEEIFTLKNGETKAFRGFMTLVELAEFSKKIVLPHEETLSKAKTDRFNLMNTTHCNFSHIYCLYMDEEQTISSVIRKVAERTPDISFTAADGVKQNLWIVTDEAVIASVEKGFADKQLFIADGHHRYETALNFRNKLREENPDDGPDALYNYVMMLLVDMDDPGLVVFPTHRMLKDLEKFDEAEVLDILSDTFRADKRPLGDNGAETMEKALADVPSTEKAFAFYTGKDYFYLLTLTDTGAMKKAISGKSDAYLGLDVTVLHTLILQKVFGIDMENMANQKNLVYTKQAEEAVSAVKSGNFQCSFLLNATKVREIKDVSLANEKMPQKSTYFYPKILTGVVMNKF
ncbi:MAG: DUF1015 domain-containing protein [Ruminococcaceae bacterium]|nr:DUF1015 domain-containing protein [Oscillospiraceae bacterium]